MELADECACGERGRPPAAAMRALGAVTPYRLPLLQSSYRRSGPKPRAA